MELCRCPRNFCAKFYKKWANDSLDPTFILYISWSGNYLKKYMGPPLIFLRLSMQNLVCLTFKLTMSVFGKHHYAPITYSWRNHLRHKHFFLIVWLGPKLGIHLHQSTCTGIMHTILKPFKSGTNITRRENCSYANFNNFNSEVSRWENVFMMS